MRLLSLEFSSCHCSVLNPFVSARRATRRPISVSPQSARRG
ncbi:hypothetical protein OP10G_4400 [Fimbriimonas ginsengisoli Gsoil 348]|uniref:Uncharacterized protein n=1 Tax=Fimbriimonas ginsengisoli Gsoil 348 TaxID=661478 RepID=A0A068NW60_FIMGI|nr:hypothetical protein OP10G_4400 [Fimbriimonas ginsengisoli Gsoil 348]